MRPPDGKDPTELGVDPLPRPEFCPTCGVSRYMIDNQERILTAHHTAHIRIAEAVALAAQSSHGAQAEAIKVLALRVADLELALRDKGTSWAERKVKRQAAHIDRLERQNARLRALLGGGR